MDFNEYQKEARETAIYPDKDCNLVYPALKLAGEAGEVAEKIGKLMRDKDYKIGTPWDFFVGGGLNTLTETVEWEDAVIKELGDVLWYVSALASELNIKLSWIAEANLRKLAARAEKGTLQGSGDDR